MTELLVRVRVAVAKCLHKLALRLEPEVDEDPWAWEVSVMKVAAAARSAPEAVEAVFEVTKTLNDRTLHLILLLLAADVAHTRGLSATTVGEWAEERKFSLIADRFDDPSE